MTTRSSDLLLKNVADYYTNAISQHGTTAKGVDWNGEESQRVRFHQLSKILRDPAHFSINDVGCGYGALFDYLRETHSSFDYCGVDVAAAMVDAARARCHAHLQARFYLGTQPPQQQDYSVASGIFSVSLETPPAQWKSYVHETLVTLDAASTQGFAFNCLTSYSDAEKMKPHLYYANPCELFDFCKQNFSRHVALLHDYGLYEFTILVRKGS
jgi:SAM-dependent methyltransferase